MRNPAETDGAVLEAIGHGAVCLHELERRLGLVPSRTATIASLKRLLNAGLVVRKEDYQKMYEMYQEGYLNSAIGRAFGISGTHAGKLIRKYQAEAGL